MAILKKGTRTVITNVIFFLLILFIGAVSSVDIYFSVKYSQYLYDLEQNPMAKALIQGNDVSLLVALKCMGTTIVLSVLYSLRKIRDIVAWLSTIGVSGCQLWLLLYILYA